MSKLLILRGIPASGKSTFARQWVTEGENRVRINRDDIRFQLFGKYWPVDEDAVSLAQDAMLRQFIGRGWDVVLDNTNLKARDVKATMKLAKSAGVDEIEFKDFPVDLREAVSRDIIRGMEGRSVGSDVINNFYNRYTPNGKFPPVPALDGEVSMAFEPYVYTPGLPHCIIVDIDGTLANLDHRSPFAKDEALYLKDGYHNHIFSIIEAYSIYRGEPLKVFLMSGREDRFRAATVEWLDTRVLEDDLFMRATGDQRNDAIVKNELFEKNIAGKYNVDFVLDDRDRVVKMWRAKGLKCLQVADGDF